MRRTGVFLASVALALGALSACSSADKEYCDKVKELGNDFMSQATSGNPGSSAEKFQGVADVAPDEVKDDWQTFADAMKALDEDPSSAASKLGDIQSASTTIQKDIQDRCS
jgi:ABC-type sugar transport system substrate-binding protein